MRAVKDLFKAKRVSSVSLIDSQVSSWWGWRLGVWEGGRVQLISNHSSCKKNVSERGEPLRGTYWWLSGKEPACQCRRRVFIPGSGRSPGGGHGNLLQHSCPGNPTDGEPGRLQSIGSRSVRHDLMTEQLQQLLYHVTYFPRGIPCSVQYLPSLT